MSIFISYSSRDAAAAERICALLEREGSRCFIAPRDIRPGKEYAEEIINGLEESVAVILLMSENANHSPHVLREVEHAVSSRIPILVYKLEEVVLTKSMEYFLMAYQWIDQGEDGNDARILDFVRELEDSGRAERAEDGIKRAGNDEADAGTAKPKTGPVKYLAVAAAVLIAAVLGAFAYGGLHRQKGADVQVGDTVFFGSYYGEDIAWRVLRISEDGNQAVLISRDILAMKAFDAAESGRYNQDEEGDYWLLDSAADTDMELQAKVRGNSDWSASNLRTWLNSELEVVAYPDQPPVSSAMAERKNGYSNEPGFLHDFTDEELAAIVEQENITKPNAVSGTEEIATCDRVYLLSLEELEWFDEAGISKWAAPTKEAVEHDDSQWYLMDYNEYGIKELSWWLREPDPEAGSLCYLVGNGYTADVVRKENAGLEGFGVRPALTVELRSVTFRDNS